MENSINSKSSFRPSVNVSDLLPLTQEPDDLDIRQILDILKRRCLVIGGVSLVVNGGVVYSTISQEAIYQGNFHILVEPVDDNNLGKINLGESNIAKPSLDYESQIQVMKSPELLSNVVNELKNNYSDFTYSSLIQDLTIRQLGTTKIIEVSYKNHDLKKIKAVLTAISKFYLNYSLDKRQTKLRQGMQFVNKQLPDIKNRVVQLQRELQIFRQKYNFIDPETQSVSISSQMQILTQQRLDINQKLVASKNNYLSLQEAEGQLVVLNNDPRYQFLLNQQRQIDAQIAGELARFQPNHPTIQTLQEKRNNLVPIIQAEARRILTLKMAEAATVMQKIEVDSQQLSKAEQELKLKLNQLPILTRQYTDIQRNLQLANESLTRFLENREMLQIQAAQTELPWELIQAPLMQDAPISPNTSRSLMLGLIASSLLGVGAALIMEKMDNTYQTSDSVKEKIKLPLLGNLPFDKTISDSRGRKVTNTPNSELNPNQMLENREIISHIFHHESGNNNYNYYSKGAFWESLQVLYSNIQLLNSDKPIRSLVVSSAMSGDGKSTLSFYLATTATSMGKKVLLVDADMRCGQIHEISGLKNIWGLSNLISANMSFEQAIQEMPEQKDLSVIPCGSIPPDPARLLASDKMKQLMNYAHQKFDLVIYDAPPLGLVDARMIAPYTDGMVLVVRLGKTDKTVLAEFKDSLTVSPINLLGIVVNGDKNQHRGYSYYYHGYGHRSYHD